MGDNHKEKSSDSTMSSPHMYSASLSHNGAIIYSQILVSVRSINSLTNE